MKQHEEWLRFRYRDFYDVPRCIFVDYRGTPYLLDCLFDDHADEYSSEYIVYRLPAIAIAEIDSDDWTRVSSFGARIGTVPVCDVTFDPTRRAMLHSKTFADLLILA